MKTKKQLFILTVVTFSLALFFACAKKDVASEAPTGDTMASDASSEGGMMEQEDATPVEDTGSAMENLTFSPVFFGYDQARLTNTARQTLRDHFTALNEHPNTKIIVEGHCDGRGTEEYNLALGERRAKAIRDYLVNLGLSTTRLSIISYGEERPKVFGEGESFWSQNRRGEFVITE